MTEVLVRLVGPVTIRCDGRIYGGRDLGSRKARTLIALLGVEPGRLVSMDRIVEMLWGDRPPHRPPANVATLVSRLRATFGAGLIIGGRSGYRLGDEVTTDLDEATEMLTAARARLVAGYPARALDAARGALELIGGAGSGVPAPSTVPASLTAPIAFTGSVVLADQPDETWAEAARVAHRELLRRGRHAVAMAALHTGDFTQAAAVAGAGLSADPLDESACRLLMRAYCALDEPGRALRAYEYLRESLARELGCDPARATRDLHLAILRDESCSGLRRAG